MDVLAPRFHSARALMWALATVLILGVPTDIIPNPIFGRDVPVRAWELPVLLATALLTAIWAGLPKRSISKQHTPMALGVTGALFAIACPVCNKIVLLILGTSGALGVWQPIQPYLAAISLAALTITVIWAWKTRPCAGKTCDY
ncbi:hypothetical protein P4N68_00440 [Corynebacterium felinum]|uniref:Cytochrome C biogenesis protein transmembrane region n=1 Tax=Corynebacterium felinum TaxID=131318 RepID=A0ABU2B7D9_9CORY|nr:hypothetical protein [Corynebacterium felinum]MDF5819552.1 hypothetical protein [Corynebacterium felinum]MDR7354321.1 hypothetical protein [Corynebacterium felinum]WJY93697.1 hypothetical protein CFELI_00190 [Corynebacterium felinum]